MLLHLVHHLKPICYIIFKLISTKPFIYIFTDSFTDLDEVTMTENQSFSERREKKKSFKRQKNYVGNIDKESYDYFQRVLSDLESHEFQDSDDKGLSKLKRLLIK